MSSKTTSASKKFFNICLVIFVTKNFNFIFFSTHTLIASGFIFNLNIFVNNYRIIITNLANRIEFKSNTKYIPNMCFVKTVYLYVY